MHFHPISQLAEPSTSKLGVCGHPLILVSPQQAAVQPRLLGVCSVGRPARMQRETGRPGSGQGCYFRLHCHACRALPRGWVTLRPPNGTRQGRAPLPTITRPPATNRIRLSRPAQLNSAPLCQTTACQTQTIILSCFVYTSLASPAWNAMISS